MKLKIKILFFLILASLAFPSQSFAKTDTPQFQIVNVSNDFSYAYAINDKEQIAGIISPVSNGFAFLWQDGVLNLLSTPPNSVSFAWGINSNGQVVGATGFTSNQGYHIHAAVWDKDKLTDLGSLP